jgi:hypothetical protein
MAVRATTDFLRGVMAKEQQWRESKFFWRNLLSRRELDLLTDDDRSSFGRNMAYYIANSGRMQGFLRAINVAFISVYLLLLAVVASIYAAIVNQQYQFYAALPFFIYLYAGFGSASFYIYPIFAWLLTGGLCSLLVCLFGDRPYGIRPWQVFLLVMAGSLLSGQIWDYEATGQRGLSRIASSRKRT